jgi:hypothetical protein
MWSSAAGCDGPRSYMQAQAGFPPRGPGFDPRSCHVGFVVDKVALGRVFSEYLGFPCQFSFHRLLHTHHHLSSGTGTIGQQWPTYQVDSVSPHTEKLKTKLHAGACSYLQAQLYRLTWRAELVGVAVTLGTCIREILRSNWPLLPSFKFFPIRHLLVIQPFNAIWFSYWKRLEIIHRKTMLYLRNLVYYGIGNIHLKTRPDPASETF